MAHLDFDITITIDHTKKLTYKGINPETAKELIALAAKEKKERYEFVEEDNA